RCFARNKTCRIRHAVAPRRDVVAGFDVARSDKNASAGRARITPPVFRVAAGNEMSGVVTKKRRSDADAVRGDRNVGCRKLEAPSSKHQRNSKHQTPNASRLPVNNPNLRKLYRP